MKKPLSILLYVNSAFATAGFLLFFGYSLFTQSWMQAGVCLVVFNVFLLVTLGSLGSLGSIRVLAGDSFFGDKE